MAQPKGLVIAEKASLMDDIKKTYKKVQGELPYTLDFACQSGHLMQLADPEVYNKDWGEKWNWGQLPMFPDNMGGWKYVPIPATKKKLDFIADMLKNNHYDFVVHAGDPDREGEYLVRLVLKRLQCTLPVKRFWTNDTTEKSITNELRHLRSDSEPFFVNITKAAYCRAHFDWLVGMNFTRAATLAMKGTARCGRVKTAVQKIVVDREKEIRNFKPTTTYELVSDYKEKFSGTLFNEDGNLSFQTKAEAEKFAKDNLKDTAVVINVEKKNETTTAPPLYRLSTLQVEASRLYGYTPDKVMDLVQSCYEKKYLTYPRTACEYLSTAMTDYFTEMLSAAATVPGLNQYIQSITTDDMKRIKGTKKYINDKELEKEGHSAIVPTTNIPDYSALTKDEQNIYAMVCKRFVAIFLPPILSEKTSIITDNNGHTFKTTGKIVRQKGFSELFGTQFENTVLPDISKGDTVHVEAIQTKEKTTTCPKRYTSGDLIELMMSPAKFLRDEKYKGIIKEVKGIGTEATRGTIIKELIKNGYIEERSGKGKAPLIYATSFGIGMIDNIGDRDIASVDLTAMWEEKLKAVEHGEMSDAVLETEIKQYIIKGVQSFQGSVMNAITPTNNSFGVCPKCGKSIFSSSKSWSCSGYKDGCTFTIWKTICGKKLTDKQAEMLLTKGYTSLIKGFTSKKTGKKFDAYLIMDENHDVKLSFDPPNQKEKPLLELKCPKCGGDIVRTQKGYGCSNYKENHCDFVIWETIAGKKITDQIVNDLITKGYTTKLKGFTSKAGNKFDAKLIYNRDTGKVEFEF